MIELKSHPLAELTTFGIGGVAESFLIPETESELFELIRRFRRDGQLYYVLGNGSNLFIGSNCIRVPVIHPLKALSACSISTDGTVVVGAGVDIRTLINQCANQGILAPVELLTIPASVGGALCMNAGRTLSGITISDQLESVTVFDGDRLVALRKADCAFGHRQSIFQARKDWLIVSAIFRFKMGEREAIAKKRQEVLKANAGKCYKIHKSAGSLFKCCNLPLMRRLQGLRVGGAMFAPRTPNCILNMGNAKPYQVRLLILLACAAHFLTLKRCKLEVEIW